MYDSGMTTIFEKLANLLINMPVCHDNMILEGFSGSFAPCPLSALSEHYDGNLCCLMRREGNIPDYS
jgi:hypothetical protein